MAQQQAHSVSNPIQVQKYLSGLDYPVGKQGIIDKAKKEGADKNILATLERLPEQEYSSPVAISRAVGQLG